MRALLLYLACCCPALPLFAQDTAYAREVLHYLTSKKCFGRGYVKNGLNTAANYIASELKAQGAVPLFISGYYQDFAFDVNTFPGSMQVKIDGKELVPGKDYLVTPDSRGLKGKFDLVKSDSVTFAPSSGDVPLRITLKKKLTFSVDQETGKYCHIELLNTGAYNGIKSAEVNIKNKLEKQFHCKNVCAFFPGSVNNDSIVVFSAHYDHLGGMGKHTFFPGGNDNASGVSMVLNLVRYYKMHPPKYKTFFIFFAGEEAGLIGSKFFTQSHVIDLKNIKFLVNLDLLGTGDDGIMVVNGAIHQKQFDLLNTINAEQKLVKDIRKRGKAMNSDHYWFTEAGVPAFFIYTLGGRAYYHDVMDTGDSLPLTDYIDVMKLITEFVDRL